mmetsp:Transcript_326/g.705  ORF Transcript_326/g.705 Transcript_326/m.705 type:complete len:97 (-) Transcript_326:67-357(-)
MGARGVILTHFSQRYKWSLEEIRKDMAQERKDEVGGKVTRIKFPNVCCAVDGLMVPLTERAMTGLETLDHAIAAATISSDGEDEEEEKDDMDDENI